MTLGLLPTPTWPDDRRMAVGNPTLQPRRDLVFGAWYSASVAIGATAGLLTLAVAAFPFSTVAALFGVAAAGAIAGTVFAMASGWVIALAISLVGWAHPLPERSLVLRTRLTGGFAMLLVYLPITWAAVALTEYGTWWLHIPVPASLIAGWVFAPSLVQRTSSPAQSAATIPTTWEPVRSDTALTSRGDTLLADDDPGATA